MKSIRLIFVLVLAGCAVFFAYRAMLNRPAISEDSHASHEIYQCPMHPQVISDEPGSCPICGMPLVKVNREEPQELAVPSHAEIHLTENQKKLIGFVWEEARERELVSTVRVLGRVGYDPDQYDSIAEYQEAAIAYRRLRGNPSTTIKERVEQLHDIGMLKLRLAGLSDRQIEGLTNTGQLVTHFSLQPDTGWIYADLYENESRKVKPGDSVRITAVSLPGKVFSGEVKSVDALLNAGSRIVRARIEMEPKAAGLLLPGTTVDAEIKIDLGRKLAVSRDAVMDTGERQIVFTDGGQEHLVPRQIRVGEEADGYYEVLEGLSPGEKIAGSATFLIDSESRLKAASLAFTAPQTTGGGADSTGSSVSESSASGHQH